MSYSLISGIAAVLALPNVLVGALLVGAALAWTKWARAGRLIATVAAVVLAIFVFTPAVNYLARPLENAYEAPQVASAPRGVIVFCSAAEPRVSQWRGQPSLTASAECLTEPVILLRRFQDMRLVYVSEAATPQMRAEQFEVASQTWASLGLATSTFETVEGSNDPRQIVDRLKATIKPEQPKAWLLVAPALEMPRLMHLFAARGLPVTAFPVDYKTGTHDTDWINRDNLTILASVSREVMTTLVLRLLGS